MALPVPGPTPVTSANPLIIALSQTALCAGDFIAGLILCCKVHHRSNSAALYRTSLTNHLTQQLLRAQALQLIPYLGGLFKFQVLGMFKHFLF